MSRLFLRKLAAAATFTACAPDFSPDAFDQVERVVDAGSRSPSDDVVDGERVDAGEDVRGDDASVDVPSDDAGAGEGQGAGPRGACDLSGRWLLTERMMTNGAGAKQVIQNWLYAEIVQQGSALTISRSLACGDKVTGLAPTIITVDDSKAWPSYLMHPSYEGRTGSSQEAGAGCQVAFQKAVLIRGATTEKYRDLSVAMPKFEEKASDATPGWEDWDADGHPGVTLRISGSITGSLYAATRTWSQYSGSIAANASSFTLPLLWGQERTTLAYEGSPLLTAQAGRDSDASQHLVEFARLTEAQTQGDSAALCVKVRELAPTLTPRAMR